MKTFMIFLMAGSLLTHFAEGVLPPLYQGVKELQSILSSPELGQKLESGDVIEKIKKTEQGYTIVTNKRELSIEVEYQKTGKIGPAPYVLKFGEPIKR